jgi:hypothetical protein
MAAASDRDVWVGGLDARSNAFVEHWNGRAWRRVAIAGDPSLLLEDLDATPSGDAWLTGITPFLEDDRNAGVVQRWDGTSWQALGDPSLANPYGLGDIDYPAVSAVEGDRAWVAGWGSDPDTDVDMPLTLITGGQGTLMPTLPLGADTDFFDIDALNATSAWVVGARVQEFPTLTFFPIAERIDCT